VSEWIIRCDDLCPIDLIIANAGVSGTSGDWDDAEALFDINMMGVVHTIHAIAPKMVARGRGQIAVMASLAGYRGLASAPAYAASKAFVKAYGEGLRGKLSPKGVKVNVICPGFVRSRLTDRNNFHMPFLMEADKAADIIVKALDKNKGRISFPWSMTFVVWLLATLPSGITDWITQKLPAKE
jgi:short-subunit dehydrogenase